MLVLILLAPSIFMFIGLALKKGSLKKWQRRISKAFYVWVCLSIAATVSATVLCATNNFDVAINVATVTPPALSSALIVLSSAQMVVYANQFKEYCEDSTSQFFRRFIDDGIMLFFFSIELYMAYAIGFAGM